MPRQKAAPQPSKKDLARAEAEALIEQAEQARSSQKRAALAHQALAVWPDCAAAYGVLIEADEEGELYYGAALSGKAIKAAERAIGLRRLNAMMGHFADDPETYQLLRYGSTCAWYSHQVGDLGRTIDVANMMLNNDPSDPLDVRLVLVGSLLQTQDIEHRVAAHRIIGEWINRDAEYRVWWLYFRALVLFQFNGDNRKAREARDEALKEDILDGPGIILQLTAETAPFAGYPLDDDVLEEDVEVLRLAWEATPDGVLWLQQGMIAFAQTFANDHGTPAARIFQSIKRKATEEDPLRGAERLIIQALHTPDDAERKALVDQALALTDDNPKAYYMAAHMETAPNRRLELYRLSAQAARRLLGDDLDSHSDDLWEDPTGRDYLMALAGIAYYEWALGDRTSAIVTCSELLLRDPDDHLHITPVLEVCLLEDRTRESAEQVLDLAQPDSEEELLEEEESDVDGDSVMRDSARNYNYALGLLQLQGFEPDETYDIDAALEMAIESNPYVPWLLLGEWEMPRKLPMQWVVGEYTEAIDYTSYAKNAWDMTPGALEALRQVASCQPQPEEPDFIFARQNPDRLGTIAPYVD